MPQYYINTASTGTGDGTTQAITGANAAWAAFSEINGEAAGDTISLNKGDEWLETLTVGASGSSGSPITFNAYGAGADPIINGADLVTTWTLEETAKEESGGTFASGFETAALADWTSVTQDGSSTFTRDGTVKNSGDYAGLFTCDVSNNDAFVTKTFAEIGSGSVFVRFYVYFEDLNNATFFTLLDGATHMIQLNTSGDEIRMWANNNGTDTTTIDVNLIEDQWYRIEVEFRIDNGDGGGILTVDGVEKIDDTSENSSGTAPDGIELGIGLGHANLYGNGEKTYFDDCKVDTSAIGAVSLESYNANTYSASVTTEPNLVVMDGTVLTKGSDQNTLADHEWFWAGNKLYVRDDTGDPDGSVVIEAAIRDYCIRMNSKDYITVDGLSLKYSNDAAVYRTGDNWIIQNCTISDTWMENIELLNTTTTTISACTLGGARNKDTVYAYNPSYITIDGCTFNVSYGANTDQVHMALGDNATISDNTFTMEGTDSGKGNVILTDWATALIENNTTAYGNFGFDVNGSGIVIRYNICHDHTGESWSSGIYSGQDANIHTGLTAYYNIIYDCTLGIYCWSTSAYSRTNHNFYNNVIYNCSSKGLYLPDDTDGAFKNNIIFCDSATETMRVDTPGTWVSDYNVIRPDGANKIVYGGTGYATLAAYAATETQDVNSINSDPLMTDPANDDFTLQTTSPCINAGTDVSLTQDYAATPVPQGDNPDIGAYEVTASGTGRNILVSGHKGVRIL